MSQDVAAVYKNTLLVVISIRLTELMTAAINNFEKKWSPHFTPNKGKKTLTMKI